MTLVIYLYVFIIFRHSSNLKTRKRKNNTVNDLDESSLNNKPKVLKRSEIIQKNLLFSAERQSANNVVKGSHLDYLYFASKKVKNLNTNKMQVRTVFFKSNTLNTKEENLFSLKDILDLYYLRINKNR